MRTLKVPTEWDIREGTGFNSHVFLRCIKIQKLRSVPALMDKCLSGVHALSSRFHVAFRLVTLGLPRMAVHEKLKQYAPVGERAELRAEC